MTPTNAFTLFLVLYLGLAISFVYIKKAFLRRSESPEAKHILYNLEFETFALPKGTVRASILILFLASLLILVSNGLGVADNLQHFFVVLTTYYATRGSTSIDQYLRKEVNLALSTDVRDQLRTQEKQIAKWNPHALFLPAFTVRGILIGATIMLAVLYTFSIETIPSYLVDSLFTFAGLFGGMFWESQRTKSGPKQYKFHDDNFNPIWSKKEWEAIVLLLGAIVVNYTYLTGLLIIPVTLPDYGTFSVFEKLVLVLLGNYFGQSASKAKIMLEEQDLNDDARYNGPLPKRDPARPRGR
jgi:hypothetical protein